MTLSDTARRFLMNIALHFSIALLGGLIINAFVKFDAQPAFIAGLCLGASVSAVKVLLIERGVANALSMNSVMAGLSAVFQITLRNVLTAGVLLASVFAKGVSVWGVTAGLLIMQSAAFALKRKGA